MAVLIEVTGALRRFEVSGVTAIGRDPQCEIQLNDARVSRRHAEIAPTSEGRYQLRDLSSTQGTFVAGRRVDELILCDGDEIQIGACALRFEDAESRSKTVEGLRVGSGIGTVVRQRLRLPSGDDAFAAARNIESPEALRRDYERLRAAFEIFRATADSDDDPQTSMRRVLSIALRLLAADRVAILLFDEVTGEMRERLARTRSGSEVELTVPLRVVEEAREQKVGLLSSDAREDARFRSANELHTAGVRSMLCVPSLVKGRTLGVLYADATTAHAFDERDLEVCAVLSHYGAAAVRHATLRVETLARAKAEERVVLLERLAGVVAHRFNNSLSVILGSVESMAQASPDCAAEVDDIRGAVESAAELTRRLLALGRAGQRHPERFATDSFVAETVALLRDVIPKEAKLQLLLMAPGWLVRADRGLLQEALTSVLRYSLARLAGGGDFVIRTEPLEVRTPDDIDVPLPAGKYALVSVRHSGERLDALEASHLFEPFATGPIERAGADSLGLAAARAVARQNGGALWLRTLEGTSEAQFCLCLPAEREGPSAGVATPPGIGAGKTVLLVDDEVVLLKVTGRALRRAGFRVIEAPSGAEAARRFNSHASEIDCVVCDVMMPGMTGPELAHALRAARPDLPFLFMSGYSDGTIGGASISARDLLAKPFRPVELVARVVEHTQRPAD